MADGDFPVLIEEVSIQKRVEQLAEEISRDYRGSDLHVVGVLRGAYQFTRDLSTKMGLPHTVDYISVASYGQGTTSSGTLQLRMDMTQPVEGKHVLLVDDIVDTGLTLNWLLDYLKSRRPQSVRTCCFLDKPSRRQIEVPTDYVGFPIEDVFVIGYGLDYQEKYRDLPFISRVSPEEVLI
ncbi:MAG: hypoxanthine phosphoribosyltransferase [Vicinamibacteria bacterium]